MQKEGTKLCPKCYKVVPKDAVFCPYCGYKFPQAVEEKTTIKCPNCGRDIPADAAICPYCGYRLVKHKPSPIYLTYKRKQTEKKYDFFTKPTYQKIRKIELIVVVIFGIIFYVAAASMINFEVKNASNVPEQLQEQIAGHFTMGIIILCVEIILFIMAVLFSILNLFNYKYSSVLSLTLIGIAILEFIGDSISSDLLNLLDKANIQYSYQMPLGAYILIGLFYLTYVLGSIECMFYYIGEATKEKS